MGKQTDDVQTTLDRCVRDLLETFRELECDNPTVPFGDMLQYVITHIMSQTYTRPADVYEAIGILETCKSHISVFGVNSLNT